MTTEGNQTEGIKFGSNTTLYRTGADTTYLNTGNRTVAYPGWMIVGKPTLRQLLRYWWKNRWA